LEGQTLLVPLSVPPLAGTGVIEFSLPLALTAIDHMLGGPGGEQAPRTLTDIEITLIQGMLDQTISTLRYALEPIVAVTPSLGAIEYNPQFVQAAAGTDAVVVGDFELIIGNQQGRLSLCLPLVPLVPRLMAQRPRSEGDSTDARAAEATARRLRDRLGDVPLDVSIRFSPLVLSPERILTLAEGDLVTLDHRAGAALTVQAGGISFGSAVAGRSGNRLAALIVDTAYGTDSTSTPGTREHA
jgi:flagellar motor switch protein FliM